MLTDDRVIARHQFTAYYVCVSCYIGSTNSYNGPTRLCVCFMLHWLHQLLQWTNQIMCMFHATLAPPTPTMDQPDYVYVSCYIGSTNSYNGPTRLCVCFMLHWLHQLLQWTNQIMCMFHATLAPPTPTMDQPDYVYVSCYIGSTNSYNGPTRLCVCFMLHWLHQLLQWTNQIMCMCHATLASPTPTMDQPDYVSVSCYIGSTHFLTIEC